MTDAALLLIGVRVLDLGDGTADLITRLLADLGADVLKIEPDGGSPWRTALPRVEGIGISFALHNANKRSAVLGGRDEFLELVDAADIVVDSGHTPAFGMSCAELADRFDHLVTMSVTDFGTACRLARHGSGALCDGDRAVSVGAVDGNPRQPPTRSARHRGAAGRETRTCIRYSRAPTDSSGSA